MNVQNVSFTGFKNVLCCKADSPEGQKGVMMALQLDNRYVRDLDKWKDIQKNLFPNQEPKDTFFVFHVDIGDYSFFNLNDRLLASSKDDFYIEPKDEASMMKFFALLKSVNSRILKGEKPDTDSGMVGSVVTNMVNIFKKQNSNPLVCSQIIEQLISGNRFPNQQQVASSMNESIEKFVDGYFNTIV